MDVCAENKRRLMAEKKRWENPPFDPKRPELHMETRKAPTKSLMQRLDLNRFHNVGPLKEGLLETSKVGIQLKQHIGAPCVVEVSVGDRVVKGQVLGKRPISDGKPALGAPIHASIDGIVTDISDEVVWIEKG